MASCDLLEQRGASELPVLSSVQSATLPIQPDIDEKFRAEPSVKPPGFCARVMAHV